MFPNLPEVVIRTNDGKLTVNAPADTVAHYGYADLVTITAVAPASYDELGIVPTIDIKEGHLVLATESQVQVIHFTKSGDKDVQDCDTFKEITVKIADGVELPTFTRDSIKINEENGTKVAKVQVKEDDNFIWLFLDGIYEQTKVSTVNDKNETVWTDTSDVNDQTKIIAEQIANNINGTKGTDYKVSGDGDKTGSRALTDVSGTALTDEKKNEIISDAGKTIKQAELMSQFAGGTGKKNDPYLISTAWHWNDMYPVLAEATEKQYFKLIANVYFTDVQLLSGQSWDFVSELDLDGNGHTVYATNFSSQYGYDILFAEIYNSNIHDITIDYLIEETGCSGFSYEAIGNNTFTNVTTSGSIRANGWVASTFVMYPYPYNGTTTVKYTNCVNTCDIVGSASYAAPFGGHCNTNGINVIFENCSNYGNISGQNASGFVGMVNGSYITFVDDNAAINYGNILGTSQAGNFVYGGPDKNGKYATTYKASYNKVEKTCTVAGSSASVGKYATFSVNNAKFGDAISFAAQTGATYYEVKLSLSVGNYGYEAVGDVWGGGYPRSLVLSYTNKDAENGVITTDLKKLYAFEPKNEKLHCLTDEKVDYTGLYVSDNYQLTEEDIVFGKLGNIIVIAENNGKEFYYVDNEAYYGLLDTALQNDPSKTKGISIYITAYTEKGGKLVSSASYSYSFSVNEAREYIAPATSQD